MCFDVQEAVLARRRRCAPHAACACRDQRIDDETNHCPLPNRRGALHGGDLPLRLRLGRRADRPSRRRHRRHRNAIRERDEQDRLLRQGNERGGAAPPWLRNAGEHLLRSAGLRRQPVRHPPRKLQDQRRRGRPASRSGLPRHRNAHHPAAGHERRGRKRRARLHLQHAELRVLHKPLPNRRRRGVERVHRGGLRVEDHLARRQPVRFRTGPRRQFSDDPALRREPDPQEIDRLQRLRLRFERLQGGCGRKPHLFLQLRRRIERPDRRP